MQPTQGPTQPRPSFILANVRSTSCQYLIQHCVTLLGALDLKPEVFAAGFDAGVVGALAASQQVALRFLYQLQPLQCCMSEHAAAAA